MIFISSQLEGITQSEIIVQKGDVIMKKKDFIKLLENIDDETNIVVPSKTQFNGYNVISDNIEIVEDYDIGNEKIAIIQEKGRLN